jgi:membrane associated rhomboid family serine protease
MFIPLSDGNPLDHISRQYVTLLLIAANCLIWIALGTPAFFSQEAVRATVYSYGFIPAVANGFEVLPLELQRIPENATYLSYSFFHGDFMHLAGNMLFVWVFGDNVEDAMGHLKFLFFYLACAAAGAIAHSMVAPDSPVPLIGASGAVAGIIAAYLLLHPKVRVWVLALGRIPLKIPAFIVLGAWIVFQIYQFTTDTESEVSWAAHVGGIVAGLILVIFLKRKSVQLFDRGIKDAELQTNAKIISPKDPITGQSTPEPIASRRNTTVPAAGKSPSIRWGRNTNKEN